MTTASIPLKPGAWMFRAGETVSIRPEGRPNNWQIRANERTWQTHVMTVPQVRQFMSELSANSIPVVQYGR